MKPWAAAGRLPRCDKCDKEFEKLLRCGRCGNAFYCSRECQNIAWKTHKLVCAKPGEAKQAEQALEPVTAPPAPATKEQPAPPPRKPAAPERVREEPGAIEDEEDKEAAAQSRRQLLRETQAINARMVQAMQESRGDPLQFLPRVLELKEELERLALDHVRASRIREKRAAARRQAVAGGAPAPAPEQERDPLQAARELTCEVMKEVISAILQKGLSPSACVDQLDVANNHYGAGLVWPRSPAAFALQDGDMEGFEPAVTKLKEKGFVCVEGLLDDEIATAIHADCQQQFWDKRDAGAMQPSGGAVSSGHECWVPYPPRRGASPELEHALRVLFGLPNEIQRHGYPVKLKVPNMAQLSCMAPGKGNERLHLDNSGASGGRELSLVLFLSPGWSEGDGGAFRAYFKADEDSPGPRPRVSAGCGEEASVRAGGGGSGRKSGHDGSGEDAAERGLAGDQEPPEEERDRFKDFNPEAGRCLIFGSRELWHEVLPATKRLYTLTLFAQCDG